MARYAIFNATTAGQALRPVDNVVEALSAADLPPWLDHAPDPDGAAIIGGTWDGAAYHPPAPPAPLLADAQAAARARVVTYADAITARITARYPASEVASWPTQAAEARAIKAGAGAVDAPLLRALAAAWGMTLDQIADAVLAKAATYTAITALVIQIRDTAMRAIDAAPDVAALEASLAAVRAQADAAAAQMGIG